MKKRLVLPLILGLLLSLFISTQALAGENADSATLVDLGSQESAEINQSTLDQYFKVKTNSAGWLTIDIVSTLSRTYIEIFDDKGNNLTSGYHDYDANLQKLNYSYSMALEAGTYYIKTSGYRRYSSDAYGTVTLSASFKEAKNKENEPNNLASSAQELTLNSKSKLRGFISWNDIDDYYKVTLKESGYFTVDVISYLSRLKVKVIGEDGTNVFDDYHDWNSTLQKAVINKAQYLEAGTYYIYLTGYRQYSSNSYGAYEISTRFTPAKNNEIESNNTVEDANVIKISSNKSSTRLGLLSLQDGTDYYKTTVSDSSSSMILSLSTNIERLGVSVFNSNGEQVYSDHLYSEVGKKTTKHKVKIDHLKKGTYYICLVNYRQYSSTYYGTYSLQVKLGKTTPSKARIYSIKEGATTISGTAEKYSTVTVKVGNKSYKVVADKSGKYKVKVSKLKKGTSVKVSYINVAGIYSSTVTTKVK